MRVGLGPRFLIEAGFIIAVAVVAGIERLRTVLIVALMAAAWGIVFVVEFVTARVRSADRMPDVKQAVAEGAPPEAPRTVTRVEREVPLPAPPSVVPEPEADAEPEPVAAANLEPVPEPEAEPEPEPVPVPEPTPEPPPLAAVVRLPEPEPPATLPEPEPEPEPQVVSFAARSSVPRQWNIWELERLTREGTGDAVRDEERSYLLMYLRDFAAADGLLPADFDGVVRESFGDVLDAVRS